MEVQLISKLFYRIDWGDLSNKKKVVTIECLMFFIIRLIR